MIPLTATRSMNPARIAAIALLAHAAAGSANTISATTSAIDTTGATLLVACVGSYAADPAPTVSDSKSNTWTPLTSYNAGSSRSTIFYCANPTVGSGHTFTATTGTGYPAIAVGAFNNVALSSPFDVQNGSGSESSSTAQPGSITPTLPNDLAVTGICLTNDASGIAINSGFTITDTIQYAGGTHFGASMAYLVQKSPAAVNPTWSGINIGLASIASFKHK